jgi:hypothetical protein
MRDEEPVISEKLGKILNGLNQIQFTEWNAAIEAAARTARTWGPPHWSWSESSLIINDTCGEISEQILKLKKDIKNGY